MSKLTAHDVTAHMIRALRVDAQIYNVPELIEVCDRAVRGDQAACELVAQALNSITDVIASYVAEVRR